MEQLQQKCAELLDQIRTMNHKFKDEELHFIMNSDDAFELYKSFISQISSKENELMTKSVFCYSEKRIFGIEIKCFDDSEKSQVYLAIKSK